MVMRSSGHKRTRTVAGCLAVLATVGVLVALLSRISSNGRRALLTWSKSAPAQNNSVRAPVTPRSPTANETPTLPTPASTVNPSPALQIPDGMSPNNLIIPVAGVRPEQLRDTFTESRAEGRVHDALDIAAPLGTPVLAAAEGTIVKLFQSERGGTTIYQLSTDKRFVYYYAHLDRYAEDLTEGHFAKQGETIAFVGNSGNAGPGNYHLHFSIAVISDPKKYWQGVNINPYPLLRK